MNKTKGCLIANFATVPNCLKALREGDTLVVWALDRLGGSLGQVITLLDDLKKRGITFIAIKDRID
ncbi:recombinase family protein, partial [Klebsiella pneumoniae]